MSATSLAPLAAESVFSREQIEIIKSQVAPRGTTDDELAMFLMYCQRTGLDPFARQIYLSERRSKNQQTGLWDVSRKPETTIDGFRLIAERSGQYAGQLGPFWCDEDGQWRDVWIPQKPPVAARVGILRHDFKEPLWAVALYDEYVQTKSDGKPNSMWSKMPSNQLGKCAESLALRRAFPRELSGLYTREEMPTEQHDAKEAQREYLADKGLEPYVAAKQPPATKPETIRELDKMLDQQPSVHMLEMRHAATVAEADAQLKEAKKDAAKGKGRSGAHGIVPLDKLENWKKLKADIREYTGNDDLYKAILQTKGGAAHANEIQTEEQAKAAWDALKAELKRLGLEANRKKQDAELIAALEQSCEIIGQRAFSDVLFEHSCNGVEDVLALESDQLQALLATLKTCVDARKGGIK